MLSYKSKVTQTAHSLLSEHIQAGDCVLDATCGNGYDTLKLAQLVSNSGQVFAIDIQEQAIINTKELLEANNFYNVRYFQVCHSQLANCIEQKCKAIVFNLGFLPKSDKAIITSSSTTLLAIKQALYLLSLNGIMLIHTYSGHRGALEEQESVACFLQNLSKKDYEVLEISEHNKEKNIEKLFVVFN